MPKKNVFTYPPMVVWVDLYMYVYRNMRACFCFCVFARVIVWEYALDCLTHMCVYVGVCVCVFSACDCVWLHVCVYVYVCLALPCLFMFIMHNFICLFAHECK